MRCTLPSARASLWLPKLSSVLVLAHRRQRLHLVVVVVHHLLVVHQLVAVRSEQQSIKRISPSKGLVPLVPSVALGGSHRLILRVGTPYLPRCHPVPVSVRLPTRGR